MLGCLILYFKGMRLMMFQLSGFYYRRISARIPLLYLKGMRKIMFQGPGFGVPYLNTFFWYLFLKGTIMK